MTNKIPDFTESELQIIATALKDRYGKEVETHLADAEMESSDEAGKVTCPVIFWRWQEASLLIFKMGQNHYSARYFYDPDEQFHPAEEDFGDIANCVLALLMAQEDHQEHTAAK